MKVLLDSSTLIAALLPDHAHHVAAHAWLSQAKSGGFDLIVSSQFGRSLFRTDPIASVTNDLARRGTPMID